MNVDDYENMKYYSSENDAREPVVSGNSWAYLVFPWNFSDSLRFREENGRDVPKVDITASTLNVYANKSRIGYTTALDLAKRDTKVILACRNAQKAEEARKAIIKESGNDKVIVQFFDFQSLDSVRNFAKRIEETEKRLDILVNNAALVGVPNEQTKDDFQIVMQINHLAPFLLTNLLLDLLKKSGKSRIVNVASMVAKMVPNGFILKDLNEYPGDTILYARTKLCNIFFTLELAERLKNTQVTVNSLHPGAIYTDLYREIKGFIKTIFDLFMKQFFKSSEAGAQTKIYLAVSEEVAGISGAHFADCKRVETYKSARNEKLQEELWRISEKLVKLNQTMK